MQRPGSYLRQNVIPSEEVYQVQSIKYCLSFRKTCNLWSSEKKVAPKPEKFGHLAPVLIRVLGRS